MLFCLAAALVAGLFCSCERKDFVTGKATTVSVNVVAIPSVAESKAVAVADGAPLENGVSNIQVLMFDAGGGVDGYAMKDSDGTVSVRTHTGWHEVWVVTNLPLTLSGVTSKAGFEAAVASLSDISLGNIVHVGTTSGEVIRGWEETVELEHFLTRVVVEKITNKMVSETLRGEELRILDVYLTNVPGTINLGKTEAPAVWYNKKGLQNEVDAFLHDAVPAASQVVPLDGSYTVRHSFYMLPNIQGDDDRSDTWSPRHTRLVVKASVGGQICYYPITLPTTASNESYNVKELVISRLGTLREETELPFTALTFDMSLEGMTPQEENLGFVARDAIVLFSEFDLAGFLADNGILTGLYSGAGAMYFTGFDLSAFIDTDGNIIGEYHSTLVMYFINFLLEGFAGQGRTLTGAVTSWTSIVFGDGSLSPWTEQAEALEVLSTQRAVYFLGKVLNPFVIQEKGLEIAPPLTFDIISDGTITWTASDTRVASKEIFYDKNGEGWKSLVSTTEGAVINVAAGDVVRFKGFNAGYGGYGAGSMWYNCFGGTAEFYAHGDISSLVNYSKSLKNYRFCALGGLFYGSNIRLHPDIPLVLPFTSLGELSYMSMFENCIYLTGMPEMPPAEEITCQAYNVFGAMFRGCTALVDIQDALPCGGSFMFYGCTSLKRAPELLAASVPAQGCNSMFYGCTALEDGPKELPATRVGYLGYCGMFQGCTSLKKAPLIKAESLDGSACVNMFVGCTSLKEASIPPATTVPDGAYGSMYSGCLSLVIVADLPATTVGTRSYSSMFSGCTSLEAGPEILAETFTGTQNCYMMFRNCSAMKSCTTKLLPREIGDQGYSLMFYGCMSLETGPEIYAETFTGNSNCISMFAGCTSMRTATTTLRAKDVPAKCYQEMFYDCTSLEAGPEILAETFTGTQNCYCMFRNCSAMKSCTTKLLPRDVGDQCYSEMFRGCSLLEAGPEIYAETFTGVQNCIRMFAGCASMIKGPSCLKVETLTNSCYYNMFYDCKKLTYIKCLATEFANNATAGWVFGVSTTGTFVKHPDTTDWNNGTSGIPSGWTVEDAVL